MNYSFFGVIVVIEDMPDQGVSAGMKGGIIEIYSKRVEGYKIELCDEQGQTVAQWHYALINSSLTSSP